MRPNHPSTMTCDQVVAVSTGAETAPVAPILPTPVRTHLGWHLQEIYSVLVADPLPTRFVDLIDRFEQASSNGAAQTPSAFRDSLLAALPALRAFSLSLAAGAAQADDLVQDTLLRAWQSQHTYQPGTNLRAWLFTILRNQFYSDCRRRRREVEDADGAFAGRMTANPDQEDGIELRQVWRKLAKLPPLQREALLLVGAQGMTYEDAADLIGCQVGTVKSRVSRGRACLALSLGFADGRLSRVPA